MASETLPQSDISADLSHLEQLASAHYAELLRIARRQRRRVRDIATLDTRAVLHEAFLRLATQRQTVWVDRPRFMAAASGMMRRVLVDHLRRRRAEKRGHGEAPLALNEDLDADPGRDAHLVALDDALDRLARVAPRLARVVECRYFGGMTEVEIAEALGVTERTVRRDWVKARGWLHDALDHGG